MGKYDSSRYRVTPLVEAIKCNKEKFDQFLSSVRISGLECPMDGGCYYYGENEKQLQPTKEHLKKMVSISIVKRGSAKKQSLFCSYSKSFSQRILENSDLGGEKGKDHEE